MRLKAAFVIGMICALGACSGSDSSDEPKSAAASKAPLFPDGFKGVCSGASVAAATPYDPKGPTHKALLFETYREDLQQSSTLPADWTVEFSTTGNALAAIDLVGCARRTADKVAKTCDGYEEDGKPTGNKVRWHTATYELSVHEATTGKKLGSATAEATDETCPMFANFDGTNQTIDMYASVADAEINDFLKPFVKP